MKLKLFCFLSTIIILSLFLCSCISNQDVRPGIDSNEVWVCEYPFAYFKFDEETMDFPGKLIYNEKEYEFFEFSNNAKILLPLHIPLTVVIVFRLHPDTVETRPNHFVATEDTPDKKFLLPLWYLFPKLWCH